MNIQQATKSYEQWMRKCGSVVESHLKYKHKQMRDDPISFLRGTYYRWAQVWPEICSYLCSAPRVLAIGDVHVDSFGTWRDAEGRLCWGIDDFDESSPLPYTNDLVRLAASIKLITDNDGLAIKMKSACEAILEGYEKSLSSEGCPIVLAEQETNLEKLGVDVIKPPEDFWSKLNSNQTVNTGVPRPAKQALEKMLPSQDLDYRLVRREAGFGSLGQLRFVAIAKWQGGYIAREAKAMVPSATAWLNGQAGQCQSYYQTAIREAVRSHDPYQKIVENWLVRRLSPDSNPIYIENLPKKRDEEALIAAMGSEIANVHLGTNRHAKKILTDLHGRQSKWLRSAAKAMAKAIEQDWKEYRSSSR